METVLIFLAGLTTTYLVARYSHRAAFTLADLSIGVFVGLAGVVLARILAGEGAPVGLSLPLFVVCGLALGLESIQPRSRRR